MRIAFIAFEYPPFIIGGAGIYAANITRELAKLGHQVTVFTPEVGNLKRKNNIDNLGIKRIKVNKRLPYKALQFWLLLPKAVKKAENENKFDIIHFNGISYWFLKKRLSKALHVITIHHLVKDAIRSANLSLISRIRDISGENSLIIPFIERRCIMCADKFIAVSNFTKKQIAKTYKITPDKIEVVYHGIDLNGYTFTKKKLEETKKSLNLPQKPILLFVGRIDDPRKGLDLVLKAVKEVLEKIDAILLVVGRGDQTEARKLAKSLGVSKNVFFAGFVDETTLKKCYSLCDIYVCPSLLEGFGLVILEAMAAGKPVVATKVGAIPEIIKDDENGILVEPGDVSELANSICKFLKNRNLSKKIGKKNGNYVRQKFSWETSAKEAEHLYMQLAGA